MPLPKIYIALPVLDEYEYIRNFIQCLSDQTYTDFKLFVCVNQPNDWWNDPNKTDVCLGNQKTLKYLTGITVFDIEVIDRSSKGNGWIGKQYGVGWARKTIMDAINNEAFKNDIIVSLDADTTFKPGYLSSIAEAFMHNTDPTALAVPYYHKLTNDDHANRAILRYEIYMRYYAANMLRIGNPYAFTAIGSAMAIPVRAYRAVGGITPHYSGEDFYFLQKLKKYGRILNWNNEWVYPAARFSDRVFFGTGPAMIKGKNGDWSSYPIYDYHFFDKVKQTYDLFQELYLTDIELPMGPFLYKTFRSKDIWDPLRKNYKTNDQFVKACQNKVDGLRILQFLKSEQKSVKQTNEENLLAWLFKFYDKKELNKLAIDFNEVNFEKSSIDDLNKLRDFLMKIENEYRKEKT